MEKKKILYIITKSNLGGAQRYVYDLATALPGDMYDVSVACGGGGLLKTRLEEAGIVTHEIRSFERDIDILKDVRAVRELFTLIRTERPDIVHLNSSKAGGMGACVARLCGVKRIIFTAHGWPFYEPRNILSRSLMWFFSYLTTLFAHHTIVVSEHDRRGARMPGLMKKITKITTALPSITFETRDDARAALFTREMIERHQGAVWIVSTGELNHNKNIEVLLHAIRALPPEKRRHAFLTIIGDGELRTHLESLVRAYNLNDCVHFTGFIPEARVFLTAFDIFVMPSQKEGFPYGLLEAGAAGLAVVASRVGGIPEIIKDGVSGLLVHPNDVATLEMCLARLIGDSTLRANMGGHLKSHVTGTYTLPRMLECTRALYESNGSTAA